MLQNGDSLHADDYVVITPFEHQVGGHKVVLQISKRFLCKPREESEVEFYNRLPVCLRSCVPQYRGEIDVQYVEGADGFELRAFVPEDLRKDIENENNEQGNINDNDQRVPTMCSEISNVCSSSRERLVNWSKQCLERTMHKYSLWSGNPSQQFVVLENLLANLERPCILDIKLGRKQKVTDCTEEKRKLLENRCAQSTSSVLGFRICGMQLYQKSTEDYISHDKYVGRNLDRDGAILNLKQFFHDGVTARTEEIEQTLDKLNHIHSAVNQQNVFNFLSVSLLLIYDSTRGSRVDVRLIDFANAVLQQDSTSTEPGSDVNEDMLFGLNSLIRILQDFLVPSTD